MECIQVEIWLLAIKLNWIECVFMNEKAENITSNMNSQNNNNKEANLVWAHWYDMLHLYGLTKCHKILLTENKNKLGVCSKSWNCWIETSYTLCVM